MWYSDVREVKSMLEIDPANTVEDKNLLWFIEQCTDVFDQQLGRDLSYKIRTQYPQGRGTQKLLLKNRPVFPTINPYPQLPFQVLTVTVDERGYYGSTPGAFDPNNSSTATPLVYGVDYCLRIDEDNGSSRSGILLRINDYWQRPIQRQVGLLTPFLGEDMGSIQVMYTAGYTVDKLPASLRLAMNQMVAQIRYLFPLGVLLSSEHYEDRSIALLNERRDALLALAKPFTWMFRNWNF